MSRRRPREHKERDPLRTYLCPDHIYLPAQGAAEDNDEPLAEVIRRCLVNYTRATEKRTGKDYAEQELGHLTPDQREHEYEDSE